MKINQLNSRRDFLGTLVLGAAVGSISSVIASPRDEKFSASTKANLSDPEKWMEKIKGSHRIVFDGSTPYNSFPVIWNWAFYLSNNETGSSDSDITAMTVLRHNAIPLHFNLAFGKKTSWEKFFM